MHWTEDDVIRHIHAVFPTRRDITPLGIGDDCACLAHPAPLVSADASVEGTHFDLAFMTLGDSAYRCLASNLSDIAAMGAVPTGWTLALGLRAELSFDEITGAIQALRECIGDHATPDAWLVGGDVVRSPAVLFSITVWGECRSGDKTWAPVTRSGANDGDWIVVFGTPGRAAAGLRLLQEQRENAARFPEVVRAFLRPRALCALGAALAQNGVVSAMMDTSDGVHSDLPRMAAQSELGFSVDISLFPEDSELSRAAALCGKPPRAFQLFGGEDYGLLAAVPPQKLEEASRLAYQYGVPAAFVGRFRAGAPQSWLDGDAPADLPDLSFEHFGKEP